MSWGVLDLAILGPALLAGLLVLSIHVPLGQQVLARGIIFIDLAVAQIAGLGVIAAHSFHWEPGGWRVQLAAGLAAIAGSIVFYFTERRWPQTQEAFIGSVFVLAASAAVLLLAASPHGGEHLRDLLTGQILWVGYRQIAAVAALYAMLLIVWFYFHRQSRSLLFYLIFAVAVTASVQLVGVFLVFASLILPALATRRLQGGARLVYGYLAGVIGYALGIVVSALTDLPTGAVIVWMLALSAAGIGFWLRIATSSQRSAVS